MGISLNPSTLLSGQGIEVSSLVQEVLSESSGQLTEWQNEQSTLQTQARDLTSINTDLSSLATAVQAFDDPLGALTQLTATSSDSSVLTATASSTATTGTHEIVVNNLASPAARHALRQNRRIREIDLQIGGTSDTTQAITITAGNLKRIPCCCSKRQRLLLLSMPVAAARPRPRSQPLVPDCDRR
jgi:flagellar capping protein FliD